MVRRYLAPVCRVVVGVMVAGLAGSALAQAVPPGSQPFMDWIASLQTQGYAVQQGTAYEFTPTACQLAAQQIFHSCFNSDPEDPYIIPEFPLGAAYTDPFYGPPTVVAAPAGTASDEFFRLDTTEAMLVIVNLPPPGAYFSYQTYLFTRPVANYPHGVAVRSPDFNRAELFATFGNSIDAVSIFKQSGIALGQGTVAFITTSNPQLAAAMTASFVAAGGDPRQVFVEPMGSNVHPGLLSGADDFINIMRYSLPQDPLQADIWRTAAAANVQVYRVGQPAGAPTGKYRSTPVSTKHINVKEASHASALAELSQLLSGWLAARQGTMPAITPAHTGEVVSRTGTILSGEFGPYCISSGTNCAGDSQDTDDYRALSVGPLPEGRMLIVAGVNHAATNDATFVSVDLQDLSLGEGVVEASATNPAAAGFSAGSLGGSAASALQDLGLYGQASANLIADLPNLYVEIFTRPCDQLQTYCVASYTTTVSDGQLPLADPILMQERAYVLPGFPNGANPTYLLSPNIIE